jgi:hypothetical protein
MKKIYFLAFISLLAAGCSKDFLKQYEDRIEGTWRLTDVDRVGFGGSLNNLPFTGGQFTFREDGGLEYTSPSGTVYKGSWDIHREWRRGNCSTDEDGNRDCDDRRVKTLSITAVDFTGQDIKSEYFHEMVFTGTDRFKAYIYSDFHTYVFRFRR